MNALGRYLVPPDWPVNILFVREVEFLHLTRYLSLGDKEEKTRNPVMDTMGTVIRQLHSFFTEKEIPCILEWNEGNHFRQPDVRMAKGFAWLLNRR